MKRVSGPEIDDIRPFFEAAVIEANKANCHRAHCGTVIVAVDGSIVGVGYNAPPLNDEGQRTCDATWDYAKKPKYDLTCCIHAEWNAVIDACKRHPDKIPGATLYLMRVDDAGNFTDAGKPFCTVCSRLTMQAGISDFALWNNDRADVFTLPEYNKLSYDYYALKA